MTATPSSRLQELLGSKSAPAYIASNYRQRFRVGVIGAGQWGTAIARIVAHNCMGKPYLFHRDVKMWVHEEMISDMKLTDIINTYHENVKYLPEVSLPFNLFAISDIHKVAEDADILVISLPFERLGEVCEQMKDIKFEKCAAILCSKEAKVSPEVEESLQATVEKLGLHPGVLTSTTIATEVAQHQPTTSLVSFSRPSWYVQGDMDKGLIRNLFTRPYFHVEVADDIPR